MLTGNKDVDFIILNKLDDIDLVNICQVNKQAKTLCNDQDFWLNRIMLKFPYLGLNVLNKHKQERLWNQYYIQDLRKINISNDVNETLVTGAEKGRLDHVMIAITNGADIHVSNDLAVREASKNGHTNVVEYLISQGAPRP